MIPSIISTDNGYVLNPIRQYVKGSVIVPASSVIPITTAAKSGTIDGASAPVLIESPVDAASEIFSLMGVQDSSVDAAVEARFSVEIIETFRTQRRYMNRPVLCNHVFGTALNPFYLRETIFLEPCQTLAFMFKNRSTAGSASFRFGLEARKFQNVNVTHMKVKEEIEKQRFGKDVFYPFWLTLDADVSLAASGKATVFATNTQDQWLMVVGAMADALTTGVAGDTTELFSASLYDPRTNRPMQTQPVTLNTGFGDAQFPHIYSTPWLIEPQSQMQIDLTNLVTDQATEVFITFLCVAMYAHKTPNLMPNIYKTRTMQPQVWDR